MFWNAQPINRKHRMYPKGDIGPARLQPAASHAASWSVTTRPPSPADLSAFLDQHYSSFHHDESLLKWALRTCLVTVSVFDRDEWVGFAMTFPLERMVMGNNVYEKVFFGNYLCVHTDHRGRGIAPVIIQRCIAESQTQGYACGIMTRVNFLNRNRAWPVAKMPLFACDALPPKDHTFPRTVRYDPAVHSQALRRWLFDSPPRKKSIRCQWSLAWFEQEHPFVLRVCLDADRRPVGAFAFLLQSDQQQDTRAHGLFHVGDDVVKTVGTAIQVATVAYSVSSYVTWQPCYNIPWMKAVNGQYVTAYTFGCSAGKETVADLDMMVW